MFCVLVLSVVVVVVVVVAVVAVPSLLHHGRDLGDHRLVLYTACSYTLHDLLHTSYDLLYNTIY